jgi:hypothetical protein
MLHPLSAGAPERREVHKWGANGTRSWQLALEQLAPLLFRTFPILPDLRVSAPVFRPGTEKMQRLAAAGTYSWRAS